MRKRKAILLGTAVLLLGPVVPTAQAQVSIHINIPLPPPLVLPAPPEVVVLPESEVYVVPDVREDLFFFDGWWWRPWQGRWYRSRYYDRGWAHYGSVPGFYRSVPQGWREDYRAHRWGGGRWDYERIHHDDLQRNWRGWHENRHWEQPEFRQHELRRDGRPYEGHAAPERPRRQEPIGRPDRPQPRPEIAPRRPDDNRGRGPAENGNRGRGPAPMPERAPARTAPERAPAKAAPERGREHADRSKEDRPREEKPHGRP